jgi:Ca-activated chloride channel family protein
VAEALGWIGREVRVADILAAAEAGQLRFMMTSASQSNSGANAYLGFLSAFAGSPDVLTSQHLHDPAVLERSRRLLGAVDRSSGSSGWLKDLFLERYADFDAMVNYEALIIEANRELVAGGREPLYAIYPVDGLAIADSPFAYVNHGNAEHEALFNQLQQYLLSPEVQHEILGLGRRVGLIGIEPDEVDTAVFNPDWGIDVTRVIAPIRIPEAEVVREALVLYQTALRKPSFTVFCLDFSGSMEGRGEEDLTRAMATLLDQEQARTYLLQTAPDDVTIIIPFNQAPIAEWKVVGNDPSALTKLLGQVTDLRAGGDTNIYDPVAGAFAAMEREGIGDRFPAVILMTDGNSNHGSFATLQNRRGTVGLDNVPVYAILFGDASESQLQEITDASSGRIFDGNRNLVEAFRSARGYN